MFVVKDEYVFSWPVKVKVPADGGSHVEQTFKARFKVLPIGTDGSDAAILREALVGWEDVTDNGNAPVPFTPKMRDQLIGIGFVRQALAVAYTEATCGGSRG